jgi:hypothetical protein
MNRQTPSSIENPLPRIFRTWLYFGVLVSMLMGACGDSGTNEQTSTPSWWLEDAGLQVTYTYPADTQTNIAKYPSIKVTFNKPVNESSADNGITLIDVAGSPVSTSFSYDSDTKTVTLFPTSLLSPESWFTLKVSGVRSEDGSEIFEGQTTYSFQSEPALATSASNPIDNYTGAYQNQVISITFNQDLDESSVGVDDFILRWGSTNFIIVTSADYNISTKTITLGYGNPGVDLPFEETVYVDFEGELTAPDPDGVGPLQGEAFDDDINWFAGGEFNFYVKFASDTTPPTWSADAPVTKAMNGKSILVQFGPNGGEHRVTDDSGSIKFIHVYRKALATTEAQDLEEGSGSGFEWYPTGNAWNDGTEVPGSPIPYGDAWPVTGESYSHQTVLSDSGENLNGSTIYWFYLGASDHSGNFGYSAPFMQTTEEIEYWGGTEGIQKMLFSDMNPPLISGMNCIMCHKANNAEGQLNLEGPYVGILDPDSVHADLLEMNGGGDMGRSIGSIERVLPYDSLNSFLYQLILAADNGDGVPAEPNKMPNYGDYGFSVENVKRIKDWIDEGAENNTSP